MKRPQTPLRRLTAAVSACFAATAFALPTGPVVVNGVASLNQAGNVLSVTNSNGAILNWQTFGIAANEAVRFNQSSASSSVLNRVVGPDPSQIFGQLTSNGRVWLINPAGILVGPGGRIDTAGFVASTLNVANQDFLAGRLNFQAAAGAGSVVNQGSIVTPAGGTVYLVGANVSNEGLISTPSGETILAAGQTVNLIDTATPGVKVEITGIQGNVTNLGEIAATAGRIGMAGVLVKNRGTLNASSVASEGGKIFLRATQKIELADASRISADGSKGGNVSAITEADGKIAGELVARGMISARGDGSQGSGGFVETSASSLKIDNAFTTDTRGGTWLLDPNDFTIAATGGDLSVASLTGALSNNDIQIQTTSGNAVCTGTGITCGPGSGSNGDIFVNDDIVWTASSSKTTLTLNAYRNIVFKSGSDTAITGNNGNIVLTAGGAINGYNAGHGANLRATQGGSIAATANNGNIALNSLVTGGVISGGSITPDGFGGESASGNITLTAPFGGISLNSIHNATVIDRMVSASTILMHPENTNSNTVTGTISLSARDNIAVGGTLETWHWLGGYSSLLGKSVGNAGGISVHSTSGALGLGDVKSGIMTWQTGTLSGNGGNISLIAGTSITATGELNSAVSNNNDDTSIGRGGDITVDAGTGITIAGAVSTSSKTGWWVQTSNPNSTGGGGNVSLLARNGAIALGGGIDTSSGVVVAPGNGGYNDWCGANCAHAQSIGSAGNVSLTATGTISLTGSLAANVFNANSATVFSGSGGVVTMSASDVQVMGPSGGAVAISTGSIAVTGPMTVSGSDISVSGPLTVTGGDLHITGNNVTLGSTISTALPGIASTNSGSVNIAATNDVHFTNIDTSLSYGGGATGDAGSVTITAGGNIVSTAATSTMSINTSTYVGGGGTAGNGGNVTLSAGGNILLPIDSTIDSQSTACNRGTNTKNSGNIALTAGGSIVAGALSSNTAQNDPGTVLGNGGRVTLDAGTGIRVGIINSGSSGGWHTYTGSSITTGNGGDVTLRTTNGNIQLDGDITTASCVAAGGDTYGGPTDYATIGKGGNISLAAGGSISGSGRTLDASSWFNLNTGLITGGTTAVAGNISVVANGGDIALGTLRTYVQGGSGGNIALASSGNINVAASIAAASGGNIVLRADSAGTGTGTLSLGSVTTSGCGRSDIYYNPVSYTDGSTKSDTASNPYSGLVTGAYTAWMLVNGVGSEGDELSGTVGLQAMATNLSGNYALGRDIAAGATTTWNTNAGFAPIGSSGSPFTGKFDGLGHVIASLYIDSTNIRNTAGLFGYVGVPAVISNTGLTNVTVYGGGVNGGSTLGALVGSNSGSITNSYTQGGSVTITPSSYCGAGNCSDVAGGLVGWNTASGAVTTSYSASAVSSNYNNKFLMGGLVGVNYGSITLSYANGNVSGSNSTSGYGNVIGGLVGWAPSGTVSNSYSTGTVTAENDYNGENIGGLIGASGGSISNSFSTSPVSVVVGYASGAYAGGLVGWATNAITNSYATGSVSMTLASDSSTNNLVGGLAGGLGTGGTVQYSYSTGVVSLSGAVSKGTAGGFIGATPTNLQSITESFWNTQTSGQPTVGVGSGSAAGAIGKSTTELMQVLSDGWSSTTWGIIPGISYPYLAWAFPSGPQIVSGTIANAGTQTQINLAKNGSRIGAANMGANGFFYTALPAGKLAAGDKLALWAQLPTSGTNTYGGVIALANAGHNTGLDYSNGSLTLTADSGTFDASTILAAYVSGSSNLPFSTSSPYVTLGNGDVTGLLFKGAGNFSIANTGSVSTLAASGVGMLYYEQPGALKIESNGNFSGISASGAVTLEASSIAVNQAISGGSSVSLSTSTGSITGSALISALSGAKAIYLTSSSGSIGSAGSPLHTRSALLTASAYDDIVITNNADASAQLTTFDCSDGCYGLDSSFGNITLVNYGAIVTGNTGAYPHGVALKAAGSISITANSPLTIGTGGVAAGGNIVLAAGSSGGANDNLTINGSVTSTSGSITLTAGNAIAVSGTLTAPGGITQTANLNPPASGGGATTAPTISACTANPALAGCTTVLPTLSVCLTNPAALGCSAVLPTLAACTTNPTAAGCSAVLPTLATCTTNPTAAGCSTILPTLATCATNPGTTGCSAVLPTLTACTTNPAAAGCSTVLPTLASCTTNPTAAGCSAVLPPLATCATTPTLAGCSSVLPTLASCTTSPAAAGCSAVLPTLASCATTPTLAGCSAVLPTLASCTTNPTQEGCATVLPTTNTTRQVTTAVETATTTKPTTTAPPTNVPPPPATGGAGTLASMQTNQTIGGTEGSFGGSSITGGGTSSGGSSGGSSSGNGSSGSSGASGDEGDKSGGAKSASGDKKDDKKDEKKDDKDSSQPKKDEGNKPSKRLAQCT